MSLVLYDRSKPLQGLITSIDDDTVHGYLTGWSQLAASPVTARFGEWAQLSATVRPSPDDPITRKVLFG